MLLLLISTLIAAIVMLVLPNEWRSSPLYFLGIMADLTLFIFSLVWVMRDRLKRLIITTVLWGILLVLGAAYTAYAIQHTIPQFRAFGYISFYFVFLGLFVIPGILIISGLMEKGRWRSVAFGVTGFIVAVYLLLLPGLLLYGVFLFVPAILILLLLTILFLWKSIKP